MGAMTPLPRTAAGSPRRTAPQPPGLPLLGNFVALQRKGQLQYNFDNWRQYGDIVRLQLGPYTAHTVAHPDYIRHVLIDNRQNYSRGRGYEPLKLLTGLGLLTNEGESWQRQRRLIQPAFTPKAVPQYAGAIAESVGAMLTRWSRIGARGAVLDINVEMLSLDFNIIGRTMFSLDLDAEARELVKAFTTAVPLVGARITAAVDIPLRVPTPANRRLVRAVRTLDTRIYGIMAGRAKSGPRHGDLLDKLLAARDAEHGGAGMSPRQVRDEVMTIFFAGHETIAQTLSWAWYLLAQHPVVEEALHAELATLNGRPPTVADLPKLAYTRMVIEETMRLYPAVWAIPRGTLGDDAIGGYDIPAGSMMFPAPYLAHRHPAFWDDPERFDPTRFTPERVAARPAGAYLPFGAGPRACIGQNFAMQEALLVLATVAQRYRLRLVPGHPVVPHSAITLSPRYGVRMTLAARNT
jgi:cytochrome P450